MKKNKFLFWIGASLLVLLAVIAGAIIPGTIAGRIANEGGADGTGLVTQDEPGLQDEPCSSGDAVSSEALRLDVYNLIYVMKPEGTDIEAVVLEHLDCSALELEFTYYNAEISYTMSQELYKRLTPGNALLPQTIKLEKLYAYYGNQNAYEAGCRIFSEMLGINADYYTVTDEDGFSSVFDFRYNSDVETDVLTLLPTVDFARSFDPQLCDVSCYMTMKLENLTTNWSISERLKYISVYNELRDSDIYCSVAPVIRHNETVEPGR